MPAAPDGRRMTAFRNGRPGARLGACLGLLALIGQLLLPLLHAQQWAERAGDGRLAIFCGELSPALLAKLVDSPVPEILKQFQGNHGKSARLACALCAPVHGGHLAAAGTAALLLPRVKHSVTLPAILPASPLVRLIRLPALRAPPGPV